MVYLVAELVWWQHLADEGSGSAGRVEEGENSKDSEELTEPIGTAYVEEIDVDSGDDKDASANSDSSLIAHDS